MTWPRRSAPGQPASVQAYVAGSITSEGPCGPSGWKREAGSGNGPSPSSLYQYRAPAPAREIERRKYPSPSAAIGSAPGKPSSTSSTLPCAGDQTAKSTPSAVHSAPIGSDRGG